MLRHLLFKVIHTSVKLGHGCTTFTVMRETSAKFRLYVGNVKYNTTISELIRIRIIICIILAPIIIKKKKFKNSIPNQALRVAICSTFFTKCLSDALYVVTDIYTVRPTSFRTDFFLRNRRPFYSKKKAPMAYIQAFTQSYSFWRAAEYSSFRTFFNSSVTAPWISATSAKSKTFYVIFNLGEQKIVWLR